MKFQRQGFQQLDHEQTETQTHPTEYITAPHLRVVIMTLNT